MKELSDEEIQRMLESGQPFAGNEHSPDVQMYQRLYEILAEEPDLDLPAGFSARIIGMVSQREVRRQSIRYYLLLSVVLLFTIGLGTMAIAFVNMPLVVKLFHFIWEAQWIILCGLVLFTLIQIGDKEIKKRLLHHTGF